MTLTDLGEFVQGLTTNIAVRRIALTYVDVAQHHTKSRKRRSIMVRRIVGETSLD